MKKIVSIVIAMFMLFALVACNNDELEKKNAELEQTNKALLEQIAQLTQGKSELEQMIEVLESDIAVLEDYCLTHVGNVEDLDQSKEELTELMAQFEDLANQVAEILEGIEDGEIDSMTELEINGITSRLESVCIWLSNLERRIEKLEGVTQKVDSLHDLRDTAREYAIYGPIPGAACGYSFENISYDIDDVGIKFYFGHLYENGKDGIEYAQIQAYPTSQDERGQLIWNDPIEILTIEDYSDAKFARSSGLVTTVDEFNGCVDIVIPREVFNEDSGAVVLAIYEYEFESFNIREGAVIELYYQVYGGRVFLFKEDPTAEN